MPLGRHEQFVWSSAVRALRDIDSDFDEAPVHLRGDSVLETKAELLDAVDTNRIRPDFSDEQTERALVFLGDVLRHSNPEAIIAELPYEEGSDGLEVVLTFPHTREHDE